MDRTPVRSTNIKSVGYDKPSLALEVEFHTGSVYRYSNVPELVYRGLLSAPSKGRYFAARIKDRYPCVKVR
jgi:hypothetical protein